LLKKVVLQLLFFTVSLFAVEAGQGTYNLAELNFELIKVFKAEYQTMSVQNLAIEPASTAGAKLGKFARIEISQGALRQPSGMFSAVFYDGAREVRVFFRYKLAAEVEIVKASKDIPKDALIEDGDIESVSMPFVGVKDKLLQKADVVGLAAKRYIRVGGIIGPKDVTKQPVVKRGSMVTAVVADSELELEFEATALEDGIAGQNLSVKGKNGKIYKAIVIGPSRVSIK